MPPEPKSHRPLLTIILVAVVGAGAASWYIYFTNPTQSPSFTEEVSLSPYSFGLEESLPPVAMPAGKIFYGNSAMNSSLDQSEVNTFAYDTTSGLVDAISFYPLRDFNPYNDTYSGMALSSTVGTDDPAAWQPYWFDNETEELTALPNVSGYWVNDLKMTDGGAKYAYVYADSDAQKNDLAVIDNWNIAIHETADGEPTIITDAAEPEWINDGADILYMGTLGLMRYNLSDKTTSVVFSDYIPNFYDTDMAVSPDFKTIILTVPYFRERNFISVLQFTDDDTLEEIGREVSDDMIYAHPVFSADGKYYAVSASTPTVDGAFTDRIEVRTLTGAQPVAVYQLPSDHQSGITTEAWFNINNIN